MRRLRSLYMGANVGSATITSWPRVSMCCATHSLSIDASSRIRIGLRLSNTAVNRSRVVAMRRSTVSPLSVTIRI
jgi:hypothetical protein